MLTGISSQNSNIQLELDIGVPTAGSTNVVQVFNYDLLMKYNPEMGTLVVLK
jgi:hypothetical protein